MLSKLNTFRVWISSGIPSLKYESLFLLCCPNCSINLTICVHIIFACTLMLVKYLSSGGNISQKSSKQKRRKYIYLFIYLYIFIYLYTYIFLSVSPNHVFRSDQQKVHKNVKQGCSEMEIRKAAYSEAGLEVTTRKAWQM